MIVLLFFCADYEIFQWRLKQLILIIIIAHSSLWGGLKWTLTRFLPGLFDSRVDRLDTSLFHPSLFFVFLAIVKLSSFFKLNSMCVYTPRGADLDFWGGGGGGVLAYLHSYFSIKGSDPLESPFPLKINLPLL